MSHYRIILPTVGAVCAIIAGVRPVYEQSANHPVFDTFDVGIRVYTVAESVVSRTDVAWYNPMNVDMVYNSKTAGKHTGTETCYTRQTNAIIAAAVFWYISIALGIATIWIEWRTLENLICAIAATITAVCGFVPIMIYIVLLATPRDTCGYGFQLQAASTSNNAVYSEGLLMLVFSTALYIASFVWAFVDYSNQ
jgi:hypothetical protein